MLQRFSYRAAEPVFETLLTAAEGYPALEREFLAAQEEIWAGFRIFDPETRLRSPEARQVGERWSDLVTHTLRRGVSINIAITDFDPIAMPRLHRATWRSVRGLVAAAEIAEAPARLRVVAAMHPASTALAPRLCFWPLIFMREWRLAGWLNRLAPEIRANALREMPGLPSRLVARADGRLWPRFWPLPRIYPATHHHKLAVFDRRRLYIGGLDLDERRFDTPSHDRDADETWHDVQLLLTGPAVAEAQHHLETFLAVTAGRSEPRRHRHLLRTLSRALPRPIFSFGPAPLIQEIADAHEHMARKARRMIYLETQYFRDLKLARYFARLAEERPDLSMILILPGAPEEVAFARRISPDARFGEFLQTRAVRIVQNAFGRRIFVGAAAQPRGAERRCVQGHGRDHLNGAPIVYIHAKVSVFDDHAAIVSSANLNGRSLRWDTEAGVALTDRTQVRTLRRRVMAHWLPAGAGAAFFDPARAVSAWRAQALANLKALPEERRGFVLPYDVAAAERDAKDLPLVPPELV